MKEVWKCEYCSSTNVDSEVIRAHEKTCAFSPFLKGCWTCKHHIDEGMPISGSMYICQLGKDIDEQSDFESKGGCDLWDTDEEGDHIDFIKTGFFKCYDKYDQELHEGDYIDVQKDGVHLIYKKDDGQLYFKPYGQEDMVSNYFSNDMVKCDESGEWIIADGIL